MATVIWPGIFPAKKQRTTPISKSVSANGGYSRLDLLETHYWWIGMDSWHGLTTFDNKKTWPVIKAFSTLAHGHLSIPKPCLGPSRLKRATSQRTQGQGCAVSGSSSVLPPAPRGGTWCFSQMSWQINQQDCHHILHTKYMYVYRYIYIYIYIYIIYIHMRNYPKTCSSNIHHSMKRFLFWLVCLFSRRDHESSGK